MPIYEYECNHCGHTLEAMRKVSDSPLKKCPACGKRSLRKLVSAGAFHLKGTGWYATDFKEKPKAKDDKKKTEEPAKSDSGTPDTKKSEKSDSSISGTKKTGNDVKPTKKKSASTTTD